MRLLGRSGGTVHDAGSWTVPLLLLAAVLVPSGCVLWYMNEAVAGQRDAARRRLSEAYRGQLALMRERLDTVWEKRAADLDARAASGSPQSIFADVVRAGAADAVVVLGREGGAAYPRPAEAAAAQGVHDTAWIEARALEGAPGGLARAADAYARIAEREKDPAQAARAQQARIRCLMQSGDKAAALRAIRQAFPARPDPRSIDPQGRLIPADAQLLALQLTRGDPAEFTRSANRLAATVNDYDLPMPAPQRLFLMQELRGQGAFAIPTYDAERLAAAFLERDRALAGDSMLRSSGVPDIWKLTSPGGRVIALYRTAALQQAMSEALQPGMSAVPPGGKSDAEEAIPAGARLPGWQIALSTRAGDPVEDSTRRKTAAYIWSGAGAIAVMAALALAVGGALRRQMRLARLKTDLVAAVSHELKTPLSSMRLLVDALLEDARPDPVKTREYLEMISRENTRLSRLIENFLTFSRMERNRHQFEFSPTTAKEVVRAVEEAAGERFHADGCSLSIEVAPGLASLQADRDALVTALLNLLDNAWKFTPGEKRIALRVFAEGGRVVFAVADNGIGIAARDRRRIFRRFYQVDRRLSRAAGGCGLGLAIVDGIVRAHGGEVRVESRPGSGSVFSVALPCAEASAGAAA